jgi:hypothetical protein
MADEHIATYLNDHLAGSVVALELLDHLVATHSETDLAAFFRQLRADIVADRDELQRIMKVLYQRESNAKGVGLDSRKNDGTETSL